METDVITADEQTRRQTRSLGPLMQPAADLAAERIVMVNVVFVGAAGASDWVLVDAGLPMSAHTIMRTAEQRYPQNPRPKAIILTHGHFDHVGALKTLARAWDVPVYAHEWELPYVTGRSAYPPPDPTVGGGLMSRLSPLYPRGPINIGRRARALPHDGTVPHLPEWRWIGTPGHSPGHVSLFRERDRALIAGDAFVTTKQESATAVLTQRPEIHGPPMYYTIDWTAAWMSVRRLVSLRPLIAITGHGVPMTGPRLQDGLHDLAKHFRDRAMPRDGRYVRRPAIANENGVLYIPPAMPDPVPKAVGGLLLGAAAVAITRRLAKRESH